MVPLLSELSFASLLIYSPRGKAPESRNSQRVCYGIKQGDPILLHRVAELTATSIDSFPDFLGPSVTLVPVPRSAPLPATDASWPALSICKALVARGLGREILPLLRRTTSVPKSAFAAPGQRPDPRTHLRSLAVDPLLYPPDHITLIDDVVTRGSTLLAGGSLIADTHPNVALRAFAVIRTLGLVPDVSELRAPCTGMIRYINGSLDRGPCFSPSLRSAPQLARPLIFADGRWRIRTSDLLRVRQTL